MEPFKSAGYFIKVNFLIDHSGYGERFQLNGKLNIIVKNIFIVKNLTDFRKTVETGVNPRL